MSFCGCMCGDGNKDSIQRGCLNYKSTIRDSVPKLVDWRLVTNYLSSLIENLGDQEACIPKNRIQILRGKHHFLRNRFTLLV